MGTILTILVNAAAFFIAAQLLSGVRLGSFVQAIIVAVFVGLLNATLGVFLKIVTLGLFSVGIFTLLLDAILIRIADYLLKDFEVRNFWWAILLAAIVAIIDGVISSIL